MKKSIFMEKAQLKKLIRQLENALIFEEKILVENQHNCYKKLPGKLNQKELEQVRTLLDTLLIQSLDHANVLGELIIKYYGKSFKEF